MFGGPGALRNALEESGAGAVVLAASRYHGLAREVLARYLDAEGSVDAFRLEVSLNRMSTVTEDA